ncbi:MAG: Gfo/Idh/MocA family oxidoreductase [Planctomycetes bacterium]|nr:Gfo/Idh/MocA family oxidoreductase [Planctomycetota bacterium]
MKRYRVGIAGFVHDHVWGELRKWVETDRVELAAAADPHEPLRERARSEFRVERLFASAEEMFEACELDVVQVCTSNAGAEPVVAAAAKRGLHVVLEKPMAATLAQADRMLAAAEEAGITFLVNWPNRWRPETYAAWKLVSQGAVGHVFHARKRMAHKGPREFGCSPYFCDWLYDREQNGGGALVDYCCYGAVAFRHLFGMPRSVQAVAARLTKTDIDVEDNAAITLIYDNRFAQAEASWSQIPAYHDAVYLGTEGTLWTDRGRLWLAREDGEKQELPVEPLADGYRNGAETLVTCLERREPPPDVCSPRVCRDAQEILAAGQRAAETGRRVELPMSSAQS